MRRNTRHTRRSLAPVQVLHIGRVLLDAAVVDAVPATLPDAEALGAALQQALSGQAAAVNRGGLCERIAAAVADQLARQLPRTDRRPA